MERENQRDLILASCLCGAFFLSVLSIPCYANTKAPKTESASKKPATPSTKATGTTAKPETKAASNKPKILPWKSFKKENERTYNIFKYNLAAGKVDAGNPDNWRAFDPLLYSNKSKLVPEPGTLQGTGPVKYPSTDCFTALDPSKIGALDGGNSKIVFAHQGTPLVNGWVAPEAGYAYQMEGILVYGTTNYTPVNYNGSMSKYIGVGRIPVDILAPGGSKGKLDLSRLVFPINDDLVSRPQSKVYPSVIYLKPGETALIQGHGNVNCPRPGQTEQITLATPSGKQQIKIVCTPDNAVIPGKVTP